jgi:signal peptidase I
MTQNNNDNQLPENGAENEWMELVKTALIAVLLALIIRAVTFEPFNIPSSSMKPTLQIGDYLFVSKFSYGYSQYSFPFGIVKFDGRIMGKEPQQGEVIVFKLPSDNKTDYIKRLIGMPGDKIQVRNGQLYINGDRIPRELISKTEIDQIPTKEYKQTLPNGVSFSIYEESDGGPLDNTRVYTVPEGHYFMMGDNRDNSQDSRVTNMVGPVPYQNLVGQAEILFFSTNGTARLWEFWKWPWTVRYERLLDFIK